MIFGLPFYIRDRQGFNDALILHIGSDFIPHVAEITLHYSLVAMVVLVALEK